MAGKSRNALVAFFEVQDEEGRALEAPIDWPAFLSFVFHQDMDARRHRINGVPHWGQVYTYKATDHLILARHRDEVSSLDISTGEIVDTESDATKPWVEVSVMHFLPDSNRFGFVLGSSAAPRVSSVAHWINEHKVLDQRITIAPVLDRDTMRKVERAEGANLVKVAFESNRIADLPESRGLYEVAQGLKMQYGDVVVELLLRTTKDHGGPREKSNILSEARHLADTGMFDKAVAGLSWHDEEGKLQKEQVDFVKHRLAKTMKIRVVDGAGKSIKVASAIEAIYRAADQLKPDLYGTPE
ncbi:hypothetical protein [Micromonospora luteifusca]|uniref:hypothetical protein n=1 Tax=Micromonospora luteifusca TaxID=709860 RepID=UPI0033BB95CC